jgi:hypothetical protein
VISFLAPGRGHDLTRAPVPVHFGTERLEGDRRFVRFAGIAVPAGGFAVMKGLGVMGVLLCLASAACADHRADTVGDSAVTALQDETNVVCLVMATRFRSFERNYLREARCLERSSPADRQTARLLRTAVAAARPEPSERRFERLLSILKDSTIAPTDLLRRALAASQAEQRFQEELGRLLGHTTGCGRLDLVLASLTRTCQALDRAFECQTLLQNVMHSGARADELARARDEAAWTMRTFSAELARLRRTAPLGPECQAVLARVADADRGDRIGGELQRVRLALGEVHRRLHEAWAQAHQVDLDELCKHLLAMQTRVRDRTIQLERARSDGRQRVLQVRALADRQALIVDEMKKVLRSFEDGDAIAFAEACRETYSDMAAAERRLRSGDTGDRTQQIEADVVEFLKDMVSAMGQAPVTDPADEHALDDDRPPKPHVFDVLEELRLLRDAQMRMTRRLERLKP